MLGFIHFFPAIFPVTLDFFPVFPRNAVKERGKRPQAPFLFVPLHQRKKMNCDVGFTFHPSPLGCKWLVNSELYGT